MTNRFVLPREAYIPSEAKGVEPLHPEGTALEVYVYTNGRSEPCLCAFDGKAAKPVARYRFGTEARRTQYLEQLIAGRKARAASKRQSAVEAQAFQHTYEVGDILVSSWGYDQTNIDFYQVVGLPGAGRKSITVQAIGSTEVPSEHSDSMHGTCVPNKGAFISSRGGRFTARVRKGGYINVRGGVAVASKWDGNPERWSSDH